MIYNWLSLTHIMLRIIFKIIKYDYWIVGADTSNFTVKWFEYKNVSINNFVSTKNIQKIYYKFLLLCRDCRVIVSFTWISYVISSLHQFYIKSLREIVTLIPNMNCKCEFFSLIHFLTDFITWEFFPTFPYMKI